MSVIVSYLFIDSECEGEKEFASLNEVDAWVASIGEDMFSYVAIYLNSDDYEDPIEDFYTMHEILHTNKQTEEEASLSQSQQRIKAHFIEQDADHTFQGWTKSTIVDFYLQYFFDVLTIDLIAEAIDCACAELRINSCK